MDELIEQVDFGEDSAADSLLLVELLHPLTKGLFARCRAQQDPPDLAMLRQVLKILQKVGLR